MKDKINEYEAMNIIREILAGKREELKTLYQAVYVGQSETTEINYINRASELVNELEDLHNQSVVLRTLINSKHQQIEEFFREELDAGTQSWATPKDLRGIISKKFEDFIEVGLLNLEGLGPQLRAIREVEANLKLTIDIAKADSKLSQLIDSIASRLEFPPFRLP